MSDFEKDKIKSELKEKIKAIIEEKTEFSYLNNDEKTADIILQIIDSDGIIPDSLQDFNSRFNELPKKADLILVAAPTGAGKDSLVRRIKYREPEKNYIELNMDRFRHYFSEFIPDVSVLQDRNFAKKTNEFSYEIYYTIQELLLQEFPGTNIIITGTLWEKDWIEEVFKKYKSNKNTDYNITISSLAVPIKDSAFSIISRYVKIIDQGIKKIDDDGKIVYENGFIPGTARYTALDYHDETYNRFLGNLDYFEKMFRSNKLVDKMEVYRRAAKRCDYSENTLVYSSDNPEDAEKTAVQVVQELRNGESQVKSGEFKELANIIRKEKNKQYFRDQRVALEILTNLISIYKGDVRSTEDLIDSKNPEGRS